MNPKRDAMKHALPLLTALLLVPFTGLRAGRNLPGVPSYGKLRAGLFQPLEDSGAMAHKAWN